MGQCIIKSNELIPDETLLEPAIQINNIQPLNNIIPNYIPVENWNDDFIPINNYDNYDNYIKPKECINSCKDLNDFYTKILEKRTTSTRTKKMLLQYKPLIEKLEIEEKKLAEDRKKFKDIDLKYQSLRQKRFTFRSALYKQFSLTHRLNIKKNKLHNKVITAVNVENMKLYNIDCEEEKYTNMMNIVNNRDINMQQLHNIFPNEILDVIASYLSYSTKILIIEKFHDPLSYLDRLGSKPIKSLVNYINYIAGDIFFLDTSKFFFISLYYQFDMLNIMNTRDEGIAIINTAINIFKEKNPKMAFNLLKMFTILNKAGSGKKYYQHIDFRLKNMYSLY